MSDAERTTAAGEVRFVAKRSTYTRAVLLPALALPPVLLGYLVWEFGWSLLRENGVAIVLAMLGALAFFFGVELWNRRDEGDLSFTEQGLGVATRRFSAVIPWEQISRVYVFKDDLHIETHAHKRVRVSLEGHDDHKPELLNALAATGRTLNLKWVQSLTDGADWLR